MFGYPTGTRGVALFEYPDFPTSLLLTPLPKGYGLALEAPARRRGRLCAGVTWRATDWIHLFTMHAYFLARKVGGRKMDPELRVEPFSRTSQVFVRKQPLWAVVAEPVPLF